MILFIVTSVLLAGVAGFLGFKVYELIKINKNQTESLNEYARAIVDAEKAITMALNYEQFYLSTLEDINSVLDIVEDLMSKRQVLSDDPDVRRLCKAIVILHDILIGYKNAKDQSPDSDGSSGDGTAAGTEEKKS